MSSSTADVGFGPTTTSTPLTLDNNNTPLVSDSYVQAILGSAKGGDATAAYFSMTNAMNKVFGQLQQSGNKAWTADVDENKNPIYYVSEYDSQGNPFYVQMAVEGINIDTDGNVVTSGETVKINGNDYKVFAQMTMTVGYNNFAFSTLSRTIGIGALSTIGSKIVLPYVWAGLKSFAKYIANKYQTWKAESSGPAAQNDELEAEEQSGPEITEETAAEGAGVVVGETAAEGAAISLGTVFCGVGIALGIALVIASFVLHNTYHRVRIFNISKYTLKWEIWFEDVEGQITDGPVAWSGGTPTPVDIQGGSVKKPTPLAKPSASISYADLKTMSSHEFAGIGYVLRFTLMNPKTSAVVKQFCVYYDLPFEGDNSQDISFDAGVIADPYAWYKSQHGKNKTKNVDRTTSDGAFEVQSSYDFLTGQHPVPAAGSASSSNEAYYYQTVLYVNEVGLTPADLPVKNTSSSLTSSGGVTIGQHLKNIRHRKGRHGDRPHDHRQERLE